MYNGTIEGATFFLAAFQTPANLMPLMQILQQNLSDWCFTVPQTKPRVREPARDRIGEDDGHVFAFALRHSVPIFDRKLQVEDERTGLGIIRVECGNLSVVLRSVRVGSPGTCAEQEQSEDDASIQLHQPATLQNSPDPRWLWWARQGLNL
jgi:hypothetical protein